MKRLFICLTAIASMVFFSCKNNNGSVAGGSDYEKVKENNKAVLAAMQKGDWAALDKYIDANAIDHSGTTGELKGLDAIKKDMMSVHAAYPDMTFEIVGTAMDGDLFYSWSKVTGTQTGPFMGMPATNQKTTMSGVDIIRIKDNKMTEHWAFMDMSEAMKAMGGAGQGHETTDTVVNKQ